MRLLVTGGREFSNIRLLRETIFWTIDEYKVTHKFYDNKDRISNLRWVTLIHGAARGVDTLAGTIGMECGMEVLPYPVLPDEYDRYNKGAPFYRNTRMLIHSKPDFGLVMPGGNGTEDMRQKLHNAGIPYVDARSGTPVRITP